MNWLRRVFDSLSGEPTDYERQGSASKLVLIATVLLTAAACSSVFGVAVGSTALGLALGNVLKVPIVVVLSGLFALPSAVLALRVLGSPVRATDLWLSQATATLAAALVLASSAPLIGLFYHSSEAFGGLAAVGTVFAAIAAGLYVFVRALRARTDGTKKRAFIPAVALVTLQLLAVVQLVGLASPILPEVTPFSNGADSLLWSQRGGH